MSPPPAEAGKYLGQLETGLKIEDLREEVFPGVPRLGMRVGLKDEVRTYNPNLLVSLYCIAELLDTPKEDGALVLEKLVPNVFSDEEFSREEVVQQQREYIAALKGLKENPGGDKPIVFALPMYGSLSIADQLKDTFPEQNLLPAWISGSFGVTTGTAERHGELPEALLDPNNIVVFADDVADSCITAAQLALERRARRLEYTEEDYEKDKYTQLIKSIQALRKERYDLGEEKGKATLERVSQINQRLSEINNELGDKYIQFAPLFQEENVVIATLYSKNHPVYKTLSQLVKDSLESGPTQWANIQGRLLKVSTEIPEDHWVVGGKGEWLHPLLDTNISGEEVLEKIPEKHQKLLQKMGLDRLSLRIGAGVESLRVFNSEKRETLIETVAGLLMRILELPSE